MGAAPVTLPPVSGTELPGLPANGSEGSSVSSLVPSSCSPSAGAFAPSAATQKRRLFLRRTPWRSTSRLYSRLFLHLVLPTAPMIKSDSIDHMAVLIRVVGQAGVSWIYTFMYLYIIYIEA